jgi:hypothetical protein
VFGFLYWKALVPVHRRVFVSLARHRVSRGTTLGLRLPLEPREAAQAGSSSEATSTATSSSWATGPTSESIT